MSFVEQFLHGYEDVLHCVAELAVHTLELIGIMIILIGSIRAVALVFAHLKSKKPINVVITLGRALSLALEFKTGAEIIKTVIVHDLRELGILALVIAIRAALAILIHWEMKMEQREHHVKEDEKED